jgi:predicted helicase
VTTIYRNYLKKLSEIYLRGDVTEGSYYQALKELFEDYASTTHRILDVTIQPKRVEIGMPDLRIKASDGKIIGYIEAKLPFDKNLEHVAPTEQLIQYRKSLPNIILTNFFEFYFFRDSFPRDKVRIANPFTLMQLRGIPPPENIDKFTDLMEKFLSFSTPETVKAEALATELAKRTRFLKNLVLEELRHGSEKILGFYQAFKDELIESLTEEQFADMYAQTITYGLFSARIQTKQADFSNYSAYELIPKRMELLRDLFYSLIGPSFPDSLKWINDDIKSLLAATRIQPLEESLFKEWGGDIIIHFYETFLKVYNPEERKHRGVYYTPPPVVSYIIRSIHKLLKTRFGKKDGLADKSVTLLDPAAGTLTFPITAIRVVKNELEAKGKEGIFPSIVREHILPHFYAFELLIPPYAIGHFRVAGVLEDLGYRLRDSDRFHFYLTNSLETKEVKELPLMPDLAKEGREAKEIKEKIPLLVVCGNPPYSFKSAKTKFTDELLKDYKEDVRSEKKYGVLEDDYIKFIRFAQWKIEQAGQGVVGMITNNSYISGIIHRGMRRKLFEAFNEIYILNLHGNARIRESTPDEGKDENVFDIMQGVVIALFVKHPAVSKKMAGGVYYADLYGLQPKKYNWLSKNDVETTKWQKLKMVEPHYFFIPKDFSLQKRYDKFWKVTEIFKEWGSGIITRRDTLAVAFKGSELHNRMMMFSNFDLPDTIISETFKITDTKEWNLHTARSQVKKENLKEGIKEYQYRPWDFRYIYYSDSIVSRTCRKWMKYLSDNNFALITTRVITDIQEKGSFVSETIGDIHIISGQSYFFPVYFYNPHNPGGQQSLYARDTPSSKHPNFNTEFLKILGETIGKELSAEEIFYYIYAVLYSNIYREKYAEFLKIDFPRIPFTSDYRLFRKMAKFGSELVELHLLKSPVFSEPEANYPATGSDRVEKREYREKESKVIINDRQYFALVPKEVWEYRIGSYQVLDHWLKDRIDRRLSLDEIEHYLKIITAIKHTIKFQQKIDKIYPEIEKLLLVGI